VKKKRDCPVCHAKIEMQKSTSGVIKALDDEEAIVPNYGLQKAVDEYKQLRHKLYDTLVELQTLKNQKVQLCKDSANPKDNSSVDLDSNKRTTDDNIQQELPNKRPKRKCIVGNSVSYLEVEPHDDVECVANHHATLSKLNDEKNDDLWDANEHQMQTMTATKLPATAVRLERKIFNLIGKKKKDLVQMCKQEGIDWSGSDVDLKERIQRFADFWRAECDREEHKSRQQVLDEFRKQEEVRKVEERRLNQSMEKQLVTRLNQSREAVGSGNSARVTSGNVIFDKKTSKGFRKLISLLGKQRNYESFHDMVTKICAKTNRNVPENLPNWKFDQDDDDDDDNEDEGNKKNDGDVVLVGSSSPHPPVVIDPYHHRQYNQKTSAMTMQTHSSLQQQSMSNTKHTNLPSGPYTNQMNLASQAAAQIVDPYHHQINRINNNTSNGTTTWQPYSSPHQPSHNNPYNSTVRTGSVPPNRPQPPQIIAWQRMPSSQPLQVPNRYHHQYRTNPPYTVKHASPQPLSSTGHVSTPTNTTNTCGMKAATTTITTTTPASRIVTDTKPPSTSTGVNGMNIPPSNYKTSQQQHHTVVDGNSMVNSQSGTWTCEFCTFRNVIKKWSRSRRKCEVCQQVATKLS